MLDLRLALTDHPPSGDMHIKIQCMKHQDSTASMAVYVDHIHCYGCQFHAIGADALAVLLGTSVADVDVTRYSSDTPERYRIQIADGAEIAPLQPAYAKLYHTFLTTVMAHRMIWFLNRGLAEDIIIRYQLGHDGYHFVIPIFNEKHELINLRRRADPLYCNEDYVKRSKYFGIKGHNGAYPYPAWVPLDKTRVYITEGELDALYLRSLGLSAYTMTNGAMQLEIIYTMFPSIRSAKQIIIATDTDETGEASAQRLAEEGRKYHLSLSRLTWEGEYKDVSEWRQQTPFEEVPICPPTF